MKECDIMEKSLKKTVLAAMLAALTYVATSFIRIPAPLGYINLGDCFVILSGYMLGPVYGALAGGIGSMLSDLFGFPLFAPATLLIKAAMAAVAAAVAKKADKPSASKQLYAVFRIISAVCAELIMIAGYFIYECFIYGAPAATAEILPNLLQGAAGAACALIIYALINRTAKNLIK